MDSPESSVSRPQVGAVEDERAASHSSLPTSALVTNVNTTSPSRTPLSTVAVQAEFHKYRTHVEKNSFQAQKEADAAPPNNVPFVTCVPAPLVAALLASPPSAAKVDSIERLDEHRLPRFTGRPVEQRQQPNFSKPAEQHHQEGILSRSADHNHQTGRSVEQRQQLNFSRSSEQHQHAGITGRSTDQQLGRSVEPRQQLITNISVGQRQQPGITNRSVDQHQQPDVTRRSVEQPSIASRSVEHPLSIASTGRSNNVSEKDSIPRSGMSYNHSQVRLPTDAMLLRNSIKDDERDVLGRRGEIPGATTESSGRSSRQESSASGGSGADSAKGGSIGITRSVLDISPGQELPPHSPIQGNVEGNADKISTKTAGSKPVQDPARIQSPPPRETENAQTGPDRQPSVVPEPPPPPPASPGRPTYSDPACDPDNPFILKFQDVTSAAFMIRNAITITPCVHSRLSRMTGMDVYLKKEFMQITGSFKERGARYALLMLTPEQRAVGIVAASLGNHALALACHGAQLAIPVTVVMPVGAPLNKESACRAYGANVIIDGVDMADSRNLALELAHKKGLTYINGYDHPHVLAGQGTLGLELLEQVCDVDAIIIPVGGGGLLAGVSVAAKTLYPKIKIIAVESENCASFSAAQAAGKPVLVKSHATIADGLAVPKVGVNAFASAASLVDRTIVVNEDLIAFSILRMVEVEKNVVEGAGAAGVAAMFSGQMDDFKGKRVVVLACGGNIDVSMLGRCLERGLVADGRLFAVTVFVDRNPSSLADLFSLVARLGASIKDMAHDRRLESDCFFDFPVKIVVETPGASTSRELRTALSQMYKKIVFHHNFEPITSHLPMYPYFLNLDCGGTERPLRRDTSSPIGSGMFNQQPPPHVSLRPSVVPSRDASPSSSAN